MTATATTKSSESDSLTGSSDKENNNDDEKEEMDEAEEGTGKEEDLLDEIETIAEAATSDASSHGANINNRNNITTSWYNIICCKNIDFICPLTCTFIRVFIYCS